MPFESHDALRCPLDGSPLVMREGGLCCENQHSFDVAKQGYVNLLGAQDKRSKDPGDSQAMVAARHRFLEAGWYQPIADRLGDCLLPTLRPDSLIVDAGCGEGYYLQQLRSRILDTGGPAPRMLGFDVSKWAMKVAARRFPGTWLVASNRRIPLADGAADVVLDMFGFPDFAAFARLLKPSGLLLRVGACEGHLLELRKVIYPHITDKSLPLAMPDGFQRVDTQRLSYAIERLPQEKIADLLLMTPHLFRASAQGKVRAASLCELTLGVDVAIDVWQKN